MCCYTSRHNELAAPTSALAAALTAQLTDAGVEQQAFSRELEQVVVHVGACNALKDLHCFSIVL